MQTNTGSKFSKWEDFKLPQLTENNYGINWPQGTKQITKELQCFKHCRMGLREEGDGLLTCFHHFLNCVQLLFPEHIDIYKDVKKSKVYKEDGRIWNNYFLDISKKLCEKENETKKKQILTGPASANKTFVVAAFAFICWVSAPHETMVLLSTTTGSASERRIWGDIKDFHRNAKFLECGLPVVGEIVDYQKTLVFDANKQVYSASLNDRDLRNAIAVVPIPTDGSGENALSTIQGSKNFFVIWILDEMAQMNPGVTRPLRNLIPGNPHVHFVGIGNANEESDPHGENSMPSGGISSLDFSVDREWRSATGYDVLFLHGEESPNYHPLINQSAVTKSTDYPFDYSTNKLGVDMVAEDAGHGDMEKGRNTVDFWKFCIGWWAPTSASSSLYTTNLVTQYNADLAPELIMGVPRVFGGGDFAFSAGGDDNALMTAEFGITDKGKKQLSFNKNCLSLRIPATNKVDFNRAVAKEFVEQINKYKIKPIDFGADIGNDAALTLKEMYILAKTHDFVGISSTGAANRPETYKNKITELWFNARDLIKTGCIRGIDIHSEFYKQLCQRKYNSLGKNFYQIEKKRDMKKRIGRSPDLADAFIYCCDMVIRSGLFDKELEEVRTILDSQEETDLAREKREESANQYRNWRNGPSAHSESEDQFEFSDSESDYETIF